MITSVNRPITVRALGLATTASVGAGAASSSLISTSSARARTEVLYLASEIGTAKTLNGIALNVDAVASGQVFSHWTIRIKPTTRNVLESNSGWDGDGWTIVHQSNQTFAEKGWITFHFDRSYDFDGQSNLLVDFSFNNAASSSASVNWRTDLSGSYRGIRGSDSSSTGSDPLTWSGSSGAYPQATATVPQTRFLGFVPIQANLPAAPAVFAGYWSGNIAFSGVGDTYCLEASDAEGHLGLSNRFAVRPPVTLPSLPFLDGFDNGKFSAAWRATPVGEYGPQVTGDYSPRTGPGHALLGVNSYPRRHELTLAANLAGYSGVILKFWAKRHGNSDQGPPPSPFIDGADFDGVAVSADGTQWYEIQPLRGMTSGVWTSFTVNLDAAIASKGLAYNSSFRIRFNQYFTFSPEYDALFIDDVSLTGSPVGRLQIAASATISESAGPASGTVSLPVATGTATVVALQTSSPLILAVPASVTIPAGQTSATFAITPQDNALRNGDIDVQVSASTAGLQAAEAVIKVQDNEVSAWSISIPATVGEGDGIVAGTLSQSLPVVGAITVQLQSSIPAAVQVPATVVIYPGEVSASFPVTIVNNNLITGIQTATIIATPEGGAPLSAQVAVNDNETRTLFLNPVSLMEGATTNGSVTLSYTADFDVVVSLVSSDPTRLAVPATVTVPKGSSTANYTMTAADNTAQEGTQTITVTGSALGFTNHQIVHQVKDNEVAQFAFGAISSSKIRGLPFQVSVSARDINNVTVGSYSGAATLTAFDDSGQLSVSPASITLASGSWNGNVTVNSFSSNVRLVASTGPGLLTGTSAPFVVSSGPATRYEWTSVTSPQIAGQPFVATITAKDAAGNVATSHSGYVQLSQVASLPERVIGSGTAATTAFPLQITYSDGRTQAIYLASELGGAATFSSISLYVDPVATVTLPNWNIRMKQTSLGSFSPAAWETAGWTTVHSSNLLLKQGWVTFDLSTPFNYNGTGNVMVDFSFDQSTFYSSSGVRVFTGVGNRVSYGVSNNGNGAPVSWSGTNPFCATSTSVPQIKLGVSGPVVSASPTVAFLTNGVWTGSVWMPGAQSSSSLKATDFSGITGTSNTFAVQAPPDTDADKLPNAWESTHGLSSGSATGDNGPQGDPDRDGIPNLLELAFDLNPQVAGLTGLPTAAVRINPADGKRYLEFTYRRLFGSAGLSYQVETADSAMAWTSDPAATELVSVVPAASTTSTEDVTVRVLPAIGTPGAPTRSARVRVIAQ